jgi:hypothetical protein
LNEQDYANLATSWITKEIADLAMLRRVDGNQGREILGRKGSIDCAGMLIPYYRPGDRRPIHYRVRRDNPEFKYDREGTPKLDRKYLGPPGDRNHLYIPPTVTIDQLRNPALPIILVEGEKKALALLRLAWHDSESPRFVPIAIPGVWNWRGTVGKTNGPNGERVDVKGPIPDLNLIECGGRKVEILFDSNVHSNDNVKWARTGLARELAGRASEVNFVNLPEDCGVNGIDDLLVAWGPERVLELFKKSVPGVRLQNVLPTQYKSTPEGMFREFLRNDQLTRSQLTNYQAHVVSEITLDDGIDIKREFKIAAQLLGQQFSFTIPASQFEKMEWPIEKMGSRAITFPRQKEYARTAIQSFSWNATEQLVYAHIGWRYINGEWLYLHAGGAIGARGPVDGVQVGLHTALRRFELQLPKDQVGLINAVRASLKTLDLGPSSVSFPLRAATCRAVFGDSDFSLHLTGGSGAYKSELAALEQQHFGAEMNRKKLPGAWFSTSNALEEEAFQSKDALLTIDDFAPRGTPAEIAQYHAKAERIFRAAGNCAGRNRLDFASRLREPRPPRGLILSTGEDVPSGHSVQARLWILELKKEDVDLTKLTECQHDAEAGLYAEAMGAFIRWLAEDREARGKELGRRRKEIQTLGQTEVPHARTPEIMSNLQAAFEMYLQFATECGAISKDEKDELLGRCWRSLLDTTSAQVRQQSETEPTAHFLTLLRGCLASGRAHLANRDGGVPEWAPKSCGWRDDHPGLVPLLDCVGWIEGEDLYLEPTAAYHCVQQYARGTQEALALSELSLKRRLRDKRLLVAVEAGRAPFTVRRTICGSQHDVLYLRRSTLFPEAPNGASAPTKN